MMDQPTRHKRQKAVALKYEEADAAPHVIASGVGEIAKRILEVAAEHDVPVEQNDSLTEILSKLEIGFEIPQQTYRAVAEILAFLYRADLEWQKKHLAAPAKKKEEFKAALEENEIVSEGDTQTLSQA